MDEPGTGTHSKLSADEELFCQAYVSCFNGRVAYQQAVDSAVTNETASSNASRMLKRSEIRSRVNELVEDKKRRFELNGDMVLHELMCIAFASLGDVMDVDGDINFVKLGASDPTFKRAIESIETDPKTGKQKVKMASKVKALELLAKNQRLLIDRVENTGANSGPVDYIVNFKSPEKK